VSQENVEILRGGFEHFRATGDFPEHLVTSDFVWDMSHFRGWPERQVYEGIEGLRDFFGDWGSAWAGWKIEAHEFHDVGDKVVAIVRLQGRSKAADLPAEMLAAQVWTFREGKEARMEMYADPAEALKAVGLDEE
jgi:ketosteroid isomerase-like protein